MNILLDTHVLLWIAFDEKHNLAPGSIELLTNPENSLFFSIANLWEIGIKSSLGKPDFSVDVKALEKGMLAAGFQELPIRAAHIDLSTRYPMIHKDPFDRLLMAQAEHEAFRLMTADSVILKYGFRHLLAAS